MRPAAGIKLYLRLTVEKIHTFATFTEKHLWSYGCLDTNFMAAVKFADAQIEIQSQISEIEIIEIQISFVTKQILF